MVQSVFTKHHVKTLRSLIQKTVDDCVVKLSTQSQPANLISSFALPVPYLVIARMLGIPDADAENLITWNAVRTSGSSTAREAAEASQGLTEYLRELVKKKEENPGDDLISKLILEQLRPGYLEMEDVVQITFLLLVAGNATVASMIGLVSSYAIKSEKHARIDVVFRRESSLFSRTLEHWRNSKVTLLWSTALWRNSCGTIPPRQWQPAELQWKTLSLAERYDDFCAAVHR